MRIERTQDVDRLLPLAEKWAAECQSRAFGFGVALRPALDDLRDWLRQWPGTLLVACDDDAVHGFLALFKLPFPLTGEPIAVEKHWYCAPDTNGAGGQLYRAAVAWAREHGCTHLIVTASGLMPESYEKIVRFCRRRDMRLFETAFMENLQVEEPTWASEPH